MRRYFIKGYNIGAKTANYVKNANIRQYMLKPCTPER